MTADATRFLGQATLSALATEPVRTSLWDGPEPIPHIRLGQWADLVVVAPATARLIGAYAAGLADDLLGATLLATTAPVVLCPAMHTEMWEHPAVRDNVDLLVRRGVRVVGPATGKLAGGDVGVGRLADPDEIVAAVGDALAVAVERPAQDLAGRRLVVAAGGTREPLDPVRFLGNRSSGKQGHALADEAAARGGEVTLVTAADRPAAPGVRVVTVETAEEMERAVLTLAEHADVVIMAAAVADFRPKAKADRKLKRSDGPPEILLEPTPDILAGLGERKPAGQVLVGFAAETHGVDTEEMRDEALAKLHRKRLDLVVANDVLAPGAGFGHDTNVVLLLDAGGTERFLPLSDKREVARVVVDKVVQVLETRGRPGGGSEEVEPKGQDK